MGGGELILRAFRLPDHRSSIDSSSRPDISAPFYARRFLRIFPLYYAALFLVFVLGRVLLPTSDPAVASIFRQQSWFWLYAANIAGYLGVLTSCHTSVWGISGRWPWKNTLPVWPLVVFFLNRRALLACVLGCVAAVPVRVISVSVHPPWWTLAVFSMCDMDGLLMGAISRAARYR